VMTPVMIQIFILMLVALSGQAILGSIFH